MVNLVKRPKLAIGLVPALCLAMTQTAFAASCDRQGKWRQGTTVGNEYAMRIRARNKTNAASWSSVVDDQMTQLDSNYTILVTRQSTNDDFEPENRDNGTTARYQQIVAFDYVAHDQDIVCTVIWDVKAQVTKRTWDPQGRFVSAKCTVPDGMSVKVDCDRNFLRDAKRQNVKFTIRNTE